MPKQRSELQGLIMMADRGRCWVFNIMRTYGSRWRRILRLGSPQSLIRISGGWRQNSEFIAVEDEVNSLKLKGIRVLMLKSVNRLFQSIWYSLLPHRIGLSAWAHAVLLPHIFSVFSHLLVEELVRQNENFSG